MSISNESNSEQKDLAQMLMQQLQYQTGLVNYVFYIQYMYIYACRQIYICTLCIERFYIMYNYQYLISQHFKK